MKARFITLEGGEGVGKTTNLAFIENHLVQNGVDFIRTREPGGTPLGESIRALLLHEGGMDARTELLLVFAARAQHVREVIEPALAAGRWVVCDRFTDASYAYQGGGRQLEMSDITWLEHWIQQGLRPDLTLLLDAPVAVGLARASRRGPADRIEAEDHAFFERVRQAYLNRALKAPERIRVVDASQTLEQVQSALAFHLDTLINDG